MTCDMWYMTYDRWGSWIFSQSFSSLANTKDRQHTNRQTLRLLDQLGQEGPEGRVGENQDLSQMNISDEYKIIPSKEPVEMKIDED